MKHKIELSRFVFLCTFVGMSDSAFPEAHLSLTFGLSKNTSTQEARRRHEEVDNRYIPAISSEDTPPPETFFDAKNPEFASGRYVLFCVFPIAPLPSPPGRSFSGFCFCVPRGARSRHIVLAMLSLLLTVSECWCCCCSLSFSSM